MFSEPLEAGYTAADVAEASGRDVLRGAGEVNRSDPYQLVVELPPLDDGTYTVTWRTLSAADGHSASGFFSFGIGPRGGATASAGSAHGTHEQADPATGLGRAVGYTGPLTAIGLPIFVSIVLRRPVRTRPVALLGGLLLVSAGATAGIALASALELGGGAGYLFGSRNGLLQLARVAVLAGGGVLVIALAPNRQRLALVLAAAAGVAAIWLLVAAGHASAALGVAPLVAQAVHVAGVGVWLTGIVLLLLLVARPSSVLAQPPVMPELVSRFSALALASIGLVTATGVYASWVQTGVLLETGTGYGRILTVKLALGVAALAFGGLNYLDGGRRLGWLGGLRTRLLAEVALAAGVLVTTGFLSATPPLEAARGVVIAPVPDAFGRLTPGMTFELVPGRPGINAVNVSVAGAIGDMPLELVLDRTDGVGGTTVALRRVTADAHGDQASPATGHGVHDAATGADLYTAAAVVLPPESAWDASVRMLSAPGADELSRQRYSFTIDAAGVAEGQAASLLDLGLGIAVLLGAGGALSIGLAYGGTRLPRCEAAASRVALAGGGVVAVVLGVLIGISRLGAIG